MTTNHIKNETGRNDNKCSIRLVMYISYIIVAVFITGLVYHYNNRMMELTYHYQATLDTVLQTPPTLMIKVPDSVVAGNDARKAFMDDLRRYMDIQYSARVEQVINASDARLSREMNYLNLWVTIWVGLIGLAGVVFPLVLGYLERRKWTHEEEKLKEDLEEKIKSVQQQKTDIEKKITDFGKELPQNVRDELWKNKELKESIGDIQGILPVMTLLSVVKDLSNYSPGTFSVPAKMEIIHKTLQNMCKGLRQICNHLSNYPDICSISHYYFLALALELNCQQIITIFTKRSLLKKWQVIQKYIRQLREALDQETVDTTIVRNNFHDLYIHLTSLTEEIKEIYDECKKSDAQRGRLV
ncbi:hypothetical protein [Parabacteroides pacaensis]|uniref:hypothetical protein n=1 Tax=Parabacteroides pacaensis TaxID=2086575 RepID=UPI000D1091C3|nr:hypothetical protein [Parabacteroides pacaensis]